MTKLITYGSKYGTTKRYAEKMAEKTALPIKNVKDLKSLEGCDHIIHFGGLYAGGVLGLPRILKLLSTTPGTSLTIITVGLSDPNDEANTQSICAGIKKQLPPSLLSQTDIYHLRGGIDYSRLSPIHRLMMHLLYSQRKKTPPESRNADTCGLIETYGTTIDFTDFNKLEELIHLFPWAN